MGEVKLFPVDGPIRYCRLSYEVVRLTVQALISNSINQADLCRFTCARNRLVYGIQGDGASRKDRGLNSRDTVNDSRTTILLGCAL